MLKLRSDTETRTASIVNSEGGFEALVEREWLLTNNRGGYSSASVAGCNTRRYQGILVGALNPPVNRIVALSNCLETLVVAGTEASISTFEFEQRISPEGYRYQKRFVRDIGVHFEYELDGARLTKSVLLDPERDIAAIAYDFAVVPEAIEFFIRPFAALRDFHTLQKSYASMSCEQSGDEVRIRHNVPYSCELFLRAEGMRFEQEQQWWFNFSYSREKVRGEEFTEDLWSPGFFKCRLERPATVVLWAGLGDGNTRPNLHKCRLASLRRRLHRKHRHLPANTAAGEPTLRTLYAAADQFVVKRQLLGGKTADTIVAGYPWFSDWGRDAFVSLPGLLLCTKRFDEAAGVLETFADAADEGLIANRFDDYSRSAHYNSIDASLWYIHAAFEYLYASGRETHFEQRLLRAVLSIVTAYNNGAKFGIRLDSDGLVSGGTERTQLTWMDAEFEGQAFTPRHGKAVEVNALWYNALCRLAEFYRDTDDERGRRYGAMAALAGESFANVFWNEFGQCLYDCVAPDGTVDASLRPNQIYAVSLPFSPLSEHQQRMVVARCEKDLLTPYGLRTLSSSDSRYRGVYSGGRAERDAAYHQGTVWAHLIGPFVEAYLKVNDYSGRSREEGMEFIRPLLEHFSSEGCLGSVSEIFDGDEPHRPRGCIAQAWAVAELLRVYVLLNR